MRIGIDSSSASSAASSVNGDESPPLASSSTPITQRQSAESFTPTPKASTKKPAYLQASSSSTSLQDEQTPEAKRLTHLERATQARHVSFGTRSFSEGRQMSPAWMRKVPNTASNNRAGLYKVNSGSDSNSAGSTSDEVDSDSEEEEWPVAPRRFGRSKLEEMQRQRHASIEAQEVAQRIRLSGQSEPITVHRAIMPRRIRLRSQQPQLVISPEAKAEEERAKAEFDNVQKVLESLRIQKDGEEAKEKRAFEARDRALWETVEAVIRKEEEARAKVAKEEQERIQRMRDQKEAAERRAREMKEAEEAKIREEEKCEERRKKEEEEKRQAKLKADEERAKQAEQEEKARNASGVGINLDREARDQFDQWWSKMNHIKADVLPVVSKNAEWRKQCFTAKRSITRGVSQLTNSRSEIVRITQSIGEVLTQAKGAAATGEIYTWILNHLSKCLIRQAEQEVAAKQDTAFPLARVVVWLLLQGHNELGDVLMARLTKKCCWCIPYCPGKKAGQEDAAYAKLLGKSNLEEATFAYTTRMTGIIAFYFAICQTTPTAPPGSTLAEVKRIPHHFRIKALWIWQARAISPRVLDQSLSPALWSALIEVAGPALLSMYGKQVSKVWKLMLMEGLGQEKAAFCKIQAANSAKVRLKQLLEDWCKSGQVKGATIGREMEV